MRDPVGGRRLDRERIEADRLRVFLTILVPLCFGFGVFLSAVSMVVSHDHNVALGGGIILVHGLCGIVARAQALRGKLANAATTSCYAFFATALILSVILPALWPVLTIVPLFAVASVLYFRHANVLRFAPPVGGLVSVLTVVLGNTLHRPDVQPAWILPVMYVAGIAVMVTLLLVFLVRFSVQIREDILEIEDAHHAATFLSESGSLLAESLEYKSTVGNVARLAATSLADWCAVDVVDDEGSLRRIVAVAATDVLPDAGSSLPPPMLRAPSDPEVLPSSMALPLVTAGKTCGVMHLGVTTRTFTTSEISVARGLAERLALAIENARLYESARRAIRAREDFLFIAGHELKTPLAALLLQAQGLERVVRRKGPETPAFVEWVERIVRSVSRLNTLVTRLLNVSHISSGKLELELEPLDLGALTREIVERFQEQASIAGSRLQVDAPDGVVGTWDRLRIDEVLTNLLSNAIKYGGGQPIEVSVYLTGQVANLIVRDYGIGIPLDKQPRIFGRFERAVSNRSYGGFGLGLWIVHEIVHALGGTIRFESEAGKGTCFYVELPQEGPARP
jgi:signal transduction histidine kinase